MRACRLTEGHLMFAPSYFPERYFARRYFPAGGSAPGAGKSSVAPLIRRRRRARRY